MGELLWQAGYFGPSNTTPRPDTAEVLELLEESFNGRKVFAAEDQAEADLEAEALRSEIEQSEIAGMSPEEFETALAQQDEANQATIVAQADQISDADLAAFVDGDGFDFTITDEQLAAELRAERASIETQDDIPFGDDAATDRPASEPSETAGESQADGVVQPKSEEVGRREGSIVSQASDRGTQGDVEQVTEATPEGEQGVIPGAEQISDKELAERQSRGAKKPTKAQKPADEGLFVDPAVRDQIDLEEAIAATQEPATVTDPDIPAIFFRGSGRADRGEIYSGPNIPILGPGQYYAFTESDAKEFGPNVEQRPASDLKNPLVIRSDGEWKALTVEAGWEFPNPSGLEPNVVERQVKKLQAIVAARGHDGIIVFWDDSTLSDTDSSGNVIKTLRDVFDKPQAIVFGPAPAAAPTLRDRAKKLSQKSLDAIPVETLQTEDGDTVEINAKIAAEDIDARLDALLAFRKCVNG